MNFFEEAKKKLEGGAVPPDRKASAMAPAVKEALIGAAELPAPEKKTGIVLNLEDFL